MKKRCGCLALAALLLAGSAVTARAEERTGKDGWKAEFTGNLVDSNFTSQSLADEVSGLLPGDSVKIQVAIVNASGRSSDWYMSNEVIQSLEDKSSAKGGAYRYELAYISGEGKETLLYSSGRVGGESSSGAGAGLHEATDSLSDFFYLDRLASGEKGYVTLQVLLDGETVGNNYQNTLAKLRLNFAVEGDALGSAGSIENAGGAPRIVTVCRDGSTVFSSGAAQTGDVGGMAFWFALALVSGLALLVHRILSNRPYGLPDFPPAASVCALLRSALNVYRRHRRLSSLLAFGMAFFLCAAPCKAADSQGNLSEPYTYAVTFYAGNQGIFSQDVAIAVTDAQGLPAKDVKISWSASAVRVSGLKSDCVITIDDIQGKALVLDENSQYYVRGIRMSGYDNNDEKPSSFKVKQDQDYVVVYGIKGEMVSYEARYEDASGKALAPGRTYRGNVGDRPMVAFLYIEGYAPQAYNLTRTLSKNEADNIFTFVYAVNGAADGSGSAAGGAGTEIIVTEEETPVTVVETGAGLDREANVIADAKAAAEADAEDGNVADMPDEGAPKSAGPTELLSLDDEEEPLAQGTGGGMPDMLAPVAVSVTAAGSLVGMAFPLLRRRRQKKEGRDA